MMGGVSRGEIEKETGEGQGRDKGRYRIGRRESQGRISGKTGERQGKDRG